MFGSDSCHKQIYCHVAEECLPKLISGINCWFLLYGLKSSGKSHILGITPDLPSEANQEDEGIIPRFTRSLFQEINDANEGNTFTVKCSVVGLYMEQLFDLLNPRARYAPFLKEGADGIQIEGTTEAFCFEEAEVISLCQRGHAYRDSIAANMNLDLRYFHTFFVIHLEHYDAASGQRKTSKMWFANISGYHAPDGASKTTDARIFCRSLSIFKSFVHSLSNKEACADYRASKLPHILKDAFVGNTFTKSMITVSPSSITFADTLNTIQLGQRMRAINKVATLATLDGGTESELNTNEYRSKYMSAQIEALVWRQRSDSLSKKNLELEATLTEEKQRVETLSVEKLAFERSATLEASDQFNNDFHDALSLFDDYQDDAVETKSLRSSLKNSQHDYHDGAVETKSLRSSLKNSQRTPAGNNPHRAKYAECMESMTTCSGAASLVASRVEEEETPPTEAIIFDVLRSSQRSIDNDLSNVDAFYFLKDIEESYPKMNVLRGRQPVKYGDLMQQLQSCVSQEGKNPVPK